MYAKVVWLENLVLFNQCVQESGGIMGIKASYTDYNGDVSVRVTYTKLDADKLNKYEAERIVKKEKE